MTSSPPTSTNGPAPPDRPPADSVARRIVRAVVRECEFIFVPQGGWTARRAVGRAVLGLIALSGPGGLAVVAAMVLYKERGHLAVAIRRGLEAVRRHRHAGRPAPRPPVRRAPARPAPSRPAPSAPMPPAPAPAPPRPGSPPEPAPRRRKEKVLG